ncbi:MAG: RNA polymerase sigma factor [Gemmatimonadetes bacterium]|nr:RNA polymerase sigma factor [Gemmatimonadota bacterium]
MSAEPDLVQRAVEGDTTALATLVAEHRPAVVRVAQQILGDREAAEDVAQDALLRLQVALPGFRGDAELATWLYRVALNLCRDHLRRRRRREVVPLTHPSAGRALAVEQEGGAGVDMERARAAVRAAIDRLPAEQAEAVRLRFLAELPYAEIARRTGVPQGTVASRVFRALVRLGEELGPTAHLEVVR